MKINKKELASNAIICLLVSYILALSFFFAESTN